MRETLFILSGLLLLAGCHSKWKERFLGGGSGTPTARQPGREDEITILVSGQSNGVSSVDNVEPAAPAAVSETGKVFLTHNRGGEVFDHQVPTSARPAIRSAAWVYLGDMIVNLTGRPVHVINVAHGNTSSYDYNRYYSEEMVLAVQAYDPDFVIWVQGESDQNQNLTPDVSYSSMKSIIDQTRKASSNLPWFVSLDGYPHSFNYADAAQMPVRIAQQKLIDEGAVHAGVDVDLLRVTDPTWFEPVSHNAAPGAEFANDGLKVHAQKWFEILRIHLNSSRAPIRAFAWWIAAAVPFGWLFRR